MDPRQARRERREAERKAKKLEVKKSRLAEKHPLAAVDKFPDIQPRWNPELEDEFPRPVQIRANAMADRVALQAGLPIPPPGPSPRTVEEYRECALARRKGAENSPAPPPAATKPLAPEPELAQEPLPNPTRIGFVSQNNPTRAEINRANAQYSTGPTSPTGKMASSGNSLKHGLASGQVIIPGEDGAAFESLFHDLLEEHQPSTLTEELLIQEMAQSHWLAQRAIRLQTGCFSDEGVDQKQLALMLRYQTTHQRAFYKALDTLLKLKKANAQSRIGFVSQPRGTAAAPHGFVSQNDPAPVTDFGFVSQNTQSAAPGWQFVRQNTAPQAPKGTEQAA